MYNTRFYYDWNAEGNTGYGWAWPGLLYVNDTETHKAGDPYIRGDVEEDDPNEVEEYDFNDLINGSRETYLTGQNFQTQKNSKVCCFIKASLTETGTPGDISIVGQMGSGTEQSGSISLASEWYLFWDDRALVGLDASGNKRTGKATTKGLKWDGSTEELYWEDSGKRYYVYGLNADGTYTCRLNNLVIWGLNNYLYRVNGGNATNGSVQCVVWKTEEVEVDVTENGEYVYDANGNRKTKKETVTRYVKRNDDDIVALYTEMPTCETMNIWDGSTDKQGYLTGISYNRSYRCFSSVWVWTKNLIRPHKNLKNQSAAQAREEALKKDIETWRTPTEFYAQNQTKETVPSGNKSWNKSIINKEDANAKKTVPVWFWCDTLHNWCTFKKIKKHTVALHAWNGKDAWVNLRKIFHKGPEDNLSVIEDHFYDLRKFVKGPTIIAQINYDRMAYYYESLKLPMDTKYSHYDSESFQTIKISKAHVDDKGTRRYPTTAGIPPIMRLPSGEIICLYYLILPGMSKRNEVIWSENIDFLNSACLAYFGKGDEKTIKDDWKVFDKINDSSEEFASDIFSADESSLVDASEINTTKEERETSLINLVVPRQYPEGITLTGESYVEKWDR